MSDFTRELIPIIVMYAFCMLLVPVIGYAMWLAFEGDRDYSAENEARAAADAAAAPAVTAAAVEVGTAEPALATAS
jgi:hypothetical protein